MARTPKPPPPPTNLPLDKAGQALFTAVLQDPDDVEARLVFADWLSERGDPRGEFVQVQCALARGSGDQPQLQKRERALLKTYEKEWVAPLRPYVRSWRWARGFVDRVVADTEAFLRGEATIFSTMPVVEVELTAMKPLMLHTLAGRATTARLRALNVGFQKLAAEALEAFDSAQWQGLRRLRLAGNRFGVAGATVLSRVRGLTGLERLEVNDAQLTDDCLEPLVRAPFFSNLTELELGWNEGITGRGLLRVLQAAPKLKVLLVRSVSLDPGELGALAKAGTALEHLRVSPGLCDAARNAFGPTVKVVD